MVSSRQGNESEAEDLLSRPVDLSKQRRARARAGGGGGWADHTRLLDRCRRRRVLWGGPWCVIVS